MSEVDFEAIARRAIVNEWLADGHARLLRIADLALRGLVGALILTYVNLPGTVEQGHHTAHLYCRLCTFRSWSFRVRDPDSRPRRLASEAATEHAIEHGERWLAECGYVVPGRHPERDVLADALCAAFASAIAALATLDSR